MSGVLEACAVVVVAGADMPAPEDKADATRKDLEKEEDGSQDNASTIRQIDACIEVKMMDANRYATKKSVAQGMLDIALLTSNATQLKHVLQAGRRHEFYSLLLVLVSTSIVLQLLAALVNVVLGYVFNINREPDQRRAELLNNTALFFTIIIMAVNVVLGVFYSLQVDMQGAA